MATTKSSKKTSARSTKKKSTMPTKLAIVKKPTTPIALGIDAPRRVKAPKRRFWRRQDKRFKQKPKLPNVFKVTKRATRLLLNNWKIVGGIVLIYGILSIILVRGLNGGTDVRQLKSLFDTFLHGIAGHLASGVGVFVLLLTSSNTNNTASNAAGAYQMLLLIVISLAVVWTFRQVLAGHKVRIRDGFYQGMYPLVPVLLVLVVVALQLLPMLGGGWLFSQVLMNSIATTWLEQTLIGTVSFILVILSFYMLCSSLFALYIVTLPAMTPLKALRSARELVRYRRWSVLRKLIFLPIVLLVVGFLIMLPFILFAAILAQWIFFVLTMVAVAAVHAYLYTLYRELLNEETAS